MVGWSAWRGSLKPDIQGQGGENIFDVDGHGGGGGLEVLKIGQLSWAPYVYRPLF